MAPPPRNPRPPLTPGEVETVPVRIHRFEGGELAAGEDVVAVEEPLEIRLGCGPEGDRRHLPLSITMRTPGADLDLAVGFLFTEGIIRASEELWEVESCGPLQRPGLHRNGVRAELHPEVEPDLERLQRHFYTTSSCGVCGKTSLEALEIAAGRSAVETHLDASLEVILSLPDRLREAQAVFGRTGGLHAAALFDPQGRLLCVREDVGRHNALDKLIGAQLHGRSQPLAAGIVLLSGRASYELLQKAFMAAAPIVCAVGAPSSLAVEAAERFGITLVGWLRPGRCTVYTHPDRLRAD